MRPVLALFSPEDAFLRIESCAGCGGHLEIVTKETKRVARLTKRIRFGRKFRLAHSRVVDHVNSGHRCKSFGVCVAPGRVP